MDLHARSHGGSNQWQKSFPRWERCRRQDTAHTLLMRHAAAKCAARRPHPQKGAATGADDLRVAGLSAPHRMPACSKSTPKIVQSIVALTPATVRSVDTIGISRMGEVTSILVVLERWQGSAEHFGILTKSLRITSQTCQMFLLKPFPEDECSQVVGNLLKMMVGTTGTTTLLGMEDMLPSMGRRPLPPPHPNLLRSGRNQLVALNWTAVGSPTTTTTQTLKPKIDILPKSACHVEEDATIPSCHWNHTYRNSQYAQK
eukprot:321726-Amphidinium_carterae.1